MPSLEDIDRKALDWAIGLGHRMIDRSYAKAWFSWLEWIGLTSLVYALARRSDSVFLYAVALASSAVLLFVGLAGVEKLCEDLLPMLKGHKWLVLFIVLATSLFGMWVVINILFWLLPQSIAA